MTGAGTGIGRAVAVRLAEEGANVVVTSRSERNAQQTADLIRATSGLDPMVFSLDQTDQSSVDRGIEAVVNRLGEIDILSNNAGIDEPSEPQVAETSDAVWDAAFAVNVTGVFRLCRAAIPHLRDGGAIVNISSGNGLAPRPNAAAYCASKAALNSFTRSLALELAPRRIRANSVCPGVVDTPLTELFLAREADPAAMRSEYAKSNPLEHIADPREIANCVLFLGSDEASFVTGIELVVDGGGLAGG